MGLDDEFERASEMRAPQDMRAFTEKIEEAAALKTQIDTLEADLVVAKSSFHVLRTKTLPDMMLELGIDKCTAQGWQCQLDDMIEGGLPKDPDRQAAAIEHIRDLGGEGILKSTITLDFPKEAHAEALAAKARIEGLGLRPVISTTVHFMTYQAFARELLQAKKHFDESKLGILVGKIVKFKPVKVKG